MMLESPLRLLPCRLCHGNFGDTGSKELPQRRTISEARVDTRLRRYYLVVLLLPNIFTLACLLLSSI